MSPRRRGHSALYFVTGILTLGMLLFPPFTGIAGTEYAFLLRGPDWVQGMGVLGPELELVARVHWYVLAAQLGVLWAVSLGIRALLGPASGASMGRGTSHSRDDVPRRPAQSE